MNPKFFFKVEMWNKEHFIMNMIRDFGDETGKLTIGHLEESSHDRFMFFADIVEYILAPFISRQS